MNIAEAQEFFIALKLSPEEAAIADKVLVEIRQRLKFLNDGVWVSDARPAFLHASGGEAQRIQLPPSRLVWWELAALDEPSIGLPAAIPAA
jgi:excinuclease ABC subunit A